MLKKFCKNKHEYNEKNTYIDKKNNRRQCRICNNLRHKSNYRSNGNKNRGSNKGLVHGTTNGYSNYGCRCQPCRSARKEWIEKRYFLHPSIKAKARERASLWHKNNQPKVKAYRIANKTAINARHRKYVLEKTYGISIEKYEKILNNQDNRCAICRKEWKMGTKYFSVDHSHKTGAIRGILCAPCNTSLGLLKENIGNIMRMLNYIGKEGIL